MILLIGSLLVYKFKRQQKYEDAHAGSMFKVSFSEMCYSKVWPILSCAWNILISGSLLVYKFKRQQKYLDAHAGSMLKVSFSEITHDFEIF